MFSLRFFDAQYKKKMLTPYIMIEYCHQFLPVLLCNTGFYSFYTLDGGALNLWVWRKPKLCFELKREKEGAEARAYWGARQDNIFIIRIVAMKSMKSVLFVLAKIFKEKKILFQKLANVL